MTTRLYFKFYLFALSIVVFTPQSNESSKFFGLVELSWPAEKLLNILLLIPLSYFILRLYPQIRDRLNLLICSVSSSLIEMIQFAIPGRFPDITDIIANTLGVGLLLLIMRNKDSIYTE
jgi:glycopeptide antibiotics resistance protein